MVEYYKRVKTLPKTIPFSQLSSADLSIDAVYEGQEKTSSTGGEPISKLLPGSGNLGGFRIAGQGQRKKFIVLYTSGEDKDWPDTLDISTGQFVYYGDNKTPGHELHDTHRGGNKILRQVFEDLHSGEREKIPPFLIFRKYPTVNSGRSAQFKGIAVPGFSGLSATEDLVAVWKSAKGQRFQNYRSVFTVLDTPVVKREWLIDVNSNNPFSSNAPVAWIHWINTARYTPLIAKPTTIIRSLEEQKPDTSLKVEIIKLIWEHFKDTPKAFEAFAAKIFQMHDPRVIIDEITRGSVDGGRDAIGRYLLGLKEDPVYAEFSLEAKCYRPSLDEQSPNTVGVKEVARLISRIRHRQFGVLVTTSVVARQAYEEVRQDQHPIIFISGKDVAEILIKNGYNNLALIKQLISQ